MSDYDPGGGKPFSPEGPGEDDDGPDGARMPLLDHLIELRNRLMISFAVMLVAFAASYYFAEEIFGFLVQPLAEALDGQGQRRLIYTALTEAFFTYLRIAFFAAAFISFPVIASQIWMFVAPGLYKNERRAFLPFLVATPVLFLAGAALAYYGVFPLAWKFFISFETVSGATNLPIVVEPKVNEYLSLVMKLVLAFGLAFQLPVLLTLLVRAGLVSAASLARSRKYAILIIFLVAAILTPPDVISQIGLAIPIILLFELSIWMARAVEKRRRQADEAENADTGSDAGG
ncbi:MAG: twin-arginine translocase subunit TatC [Alphaproteobacteria bacterium]